MKKIVLSLASVLAATAFAPEAAAVPAFARQTGMACNACHFQHFPVLNSFGRAFKAGGYTMMGAQGKVEGEHMSIPDTLNMSMLIKMRYQKSSGTDDGTKPPGVSKNDGQWQFPDEFVFLVGGRVAENVGVLMELGLGGAPGAATANDNAAMMGIFKMPFVWDVGSVKLGVTPFVTDTQGAFVGYDMSSSGQVRASRWAEDRGATSSQNYVGVGAGAATGIAFSANSDMGYIALSRMSPNHASSEGGSGGQEYKTNVLRIAATPNISDWALHIGAGFINGSNYQLQTGNVPVTLGQKVDVKGQTLDFQAQGQLGGKDTSFYINYAKAPASTTGCTAPAAGAVAPAIPCNMYNATGVTDKTAWVIAGDYSVIQHTLSIGAAYRMATDSKTAAQQTAGAGDKNNAFTVTAVYDMYQNVALHLNHTMQSGNAWNAGGTQVGNLAVNKNGKNMTTLMLEASW